MDERELAEELERSRDDEGEWSDDRANVEVRPGRTQVVSFRLPLEELEVLAAMTSETGESLSEFIRNAIEHRVRHVVAPTMDLTHTALSVTVRQAPLSSGWNEADPFYVTDLGRGELAASG
jgi:Ribbon-helix-helix protein, copG family